MMSVTRTAKFLTERARQQLFLRNFRIGMAISATTKASQLQSEAVSAMATEKSRPTRLLDGQACQIIPGKEFFFSFEMILF